MTLPLVATPGASTAVVLRNSIGSGARAGLFTALGCNAGSILYGVLTAFGFAAALKEWPSVWVVLRIVGIGYLAWLGLSSLARAVRGTPAAQTGGPWAHDIWHSISSGFLTNFFNPSLAAFYLVILPQFIPRGAPFARSALVLTAVHVSMAAFWHVAWALAGSTMARVLSSGGPRRALDAIAGAALLALAAKVAIG